MKREIEHNGFFSNLREKVVKKAIAPAVIASFTATAIPALASQEQDSEKNPAIVSTSVEAQPFTDVSETHPYKNAIYSMRDAGIISGYQVGTGWEFRPNNPILRAQFAKMIDGALGLIVTEDSWKDEQKSFNDLGADDLSSLYPHDYIAVCAENGITKGVRDREFAPWEEITRAQVVTMITRAIEKLKPGYLRDVPQNYTNSIGFTDDTHGKNLDTLEYNGFLLPLSDYDRSWNPWEKANRGEVAYLLNRFMQMNMIEQRGLEGSPIVETSIEDIVNHSRLTNFSEISSGQYQIPDDIQIRYQQIRPDSEIVWISENKQSVLPKNLKRISAKTGQEYIWDTNWFGTKYTTEGEPFRSVIVYDGIKPIDGSDEFYIQGKDGDGNIISEGIINLAPAFPNCTSLRVVNAGVVVQDIDTEFRVAKYKAQTQLNFGLIWNDFIKKGEAANIIYLRDQWTGKILRDGKGVPYIGIVEVYSNLDNYSARKEVLDKSFNK